MSHYSDYTAESEVSTTHIDIEVFLGEAFCAFLMHGQCHQIFGFGWNLRFIEYPFVH